MRIALDVSIQETPHVTGVERVQRSLIEALAAADRVNEYLLLSRRPIDLGLALPPSWRSLAVVERGSAYLWRERFVPRVLERERIDVFHSPVSAIPILGRARKIATIHELPWVERGRQKDQAKKATDATERAPPAHKVWLFLDVKNAWRIVCGSAWTRASVLQLYPGAAARLRVLHHGVDARFRPLDPRPARADVLARLGIEDAPFVLFVGTLRRKKNLRLLLRAFAGFPPKERDAFTLVLAGVRSTAFGGELEAALADPRLAGRVALPGYVADEDLVALYNLASCVVYPSLFEGFGLPPLEAMACGAPVVASRGGAIPEVVGDAASLFEPADEQALRAAVLRVLTDRAHAAELVSAGFAQAGRYRWSGVAARYLDLYAEAGRG